MILFQFGNTDCRSSLNATFQTLIVKGALSISKTINSFLRSFAYRREKRPWGCLSLGISEMVDDPGLGNAASRTASHPAASQSFKELALDGFILLNRSW